MLSFAAVNHVSEPFRSRLWFVIGRFRSILLVSFFLQGSLVVVEVAIDASQIISEVLNLGVRVLKNSRLKKL